jgi:arylsulfatase A-like enzyme
MIKKLFAIAIVLALFSCNNQEQKQTAETSPNIILIMTDDQGWAQTGYYNHPVLKTPNLDSMAANGLRFDRFYAAGPVCSPTRASVLTGRTHDRTGVYTHGFALRRQEKTLSEALNNAGYATGHFGKWHLNGLRGPGVPIFDDDIYSPGAFGFEDWVSVTNFFDIDPLMSDNGEFKEFKGTTSEIIAAQAIEFIEKSMTNQKPFFAVIWDGSPHRPMKATQEDRAPYDHLNEISANQHGEIAAFDRSLGMIRDKLRQLNIANNTIIWFCSDNGGLHDIEPSTVGNLRDFKGSLYEGGIRVPAIIEWPAEVKPAITKYPASTMDIFPTIASIIQLPDTVMLQPQDGQSLVKLWQEEEGVAKREQPIPFRYSNGGALVNNDFKIFTENRDSGIYQLYNLSSDPLESTDVSDQYPDIYESMISTYKKWDETVEISIKGLDYPEGVVTDSSRDHTWMKDPRYEPYLDEWVKRWEYKERIERSRSQ